MSFCNQRLPASNSLTTTVPPLKAPAKPDLLEPLRLSEPIHMHSVTADASGSATIGVGKTHSSKLDLVYVNADFVRQGEKYEMIISGA